MVMIAQRHVQRRDGTELCKESEEMGQPFWYIEQVAGDENPIWAKLAHSFDNIVVPRFISVEVQIREMDGPAPGEYRVAVSEHGDFVIGQPPFPLRNEAERPIERFAQAGADEGSHMVRP
jgi:hypothetical protein